MPQTIDQLLKTIAREAVPPVILVGGNNEYLASQAFAAVRDAIVDAAPSIQIEPFAEGTDLSTVLDSFRSFSIFQRPRLLLVPAVNAFVTRKESQSHYEKAVNDWKAAKTEKKRASAMAKLLHLLGLLGLDVDSTESSIRSALGLSAAQPALGEILELARSTGKRATRGEGEASLLAEAITQGGASGACLLMRTGEIPLDSATVKLIDLAGAVVVLDLGRETFQKALEKAISEIEEEYEAKFDASAVSRLMQRMGAERILADKFSKDVPDLGMIVSEAVRLATLAGSGKRVTGQLVDEQIATVAGGARYELGSLLSEGKVLEALGKLRELVAQSKREDPKSATDIHYGKFIFAIADELRQLLAVLSFARVQKIDLRRSIPYNRFRDEVADSLNDYMAECGASKRKLHPFPLHKKMEGARRFTEAQLLTALSELAFIDLQRKSGGISAEIGLETLLLSFAKGA